MEFNEWLVNNYGHDNSVQEFGRSDLMSAFNAGRNPIPLETVVGEKTEDVDPVIVNITEERFIHTMNILESVANKTISVPVDSILIENNKEKLLVETICEMQKSVVFAMETLSSFSA